MASRGAGAGVRLRLVGGVVGGGTRVTVWRSLAAGDGLAKHGMRMFGMCRRRFWMLNVKKKRPCWRVFSPRKKLPSRSRELIIYIPDAVAGESARLMPTQGMAPYAARFLLVLCLPVAVLAAGPPWDERCPTAPLVSAANMYTASSDPANTENKVNCYWLDRTKYTCADYGHLADDGHFNGYVRMCMNNPNDPQRCKADQVPGVRKRHGSGEGGRCCSVRPYK